MIMLVFIFQEIVLQVCLNVNNYFDKFVLVDSDKQWEERKEQNSFVGSKLFQFLN